MQMVHNKPNNCNVYLKSQTRVAIKKEIHFVSLYLWSMVSSRQYTADPEHC